MTKYLIQFVVGIPVAICVFSGLQKEFKLPLHYAFPIGVVLLTTYNIAVLNTLNDD